MLFNSVAVSSVGLLQNPLIRWFPSGLNLRWCRLFQVAMFHDTALSINTPSLSPKRNTPRKNLHMPWLPLFEGGLELKLPTIWTVGSRSGKSQRGEDKKWEDQRGERKGRKKRQVREKVGKSRFTVFFQWFEAQEGRKVGSLKRRVRSHVVRWEMKNCTPLWPEARFPVKMHKTHHSRTTFGSWDVEKVHAVVARSTFPSQKCQKLRRLDTFWRSDVEKVHTD